MAFFLLTGAPLRPANAAPEVIGGVCSIKIEVSLDGSDFALSTLPGGTCVTTEGVGHAHLSGTLSAHPDLDDTPCAAALWTSEALSVSFEGEEWTWAPESDAETNGVKVGDAIALTMTASDGGFVAVATLVQLPPSAAACSDPTATVVWKGAIVWEDPTIE